MFYGVEVAAIRGAIHQFSVSFSYTCLEGTYEYFMERYGQKKVTIHAYLIVTIHAYLIVTIHGATAVIMFENAY